MYLMWMFLMWSGSFLSVTWLKKELNVHPPPPDVFYSVLRLSELSIKISLAQHWSAYPVSGYQLSSQESVLLSVLPPLR